MNQDSLYLTLMTLPALITGMACIIGLALIVLIDNAKMIIRVANTLSVMLIIVGLYEIAIITYVAVIKLIN